MHYDITIIGAGVVGGLIARQLSSYENSVCIIDAANDVAMGASKANSGIVHAGYDPAPGTNKAKFNLKGAELMEDICNDLGVKFKRNGAMVVSYNERENRELFYLLERGRINGIEQMKIISGDEARIMEPNLSKEIISALYIPTSAIVCPYQLTIAAVGNAMDNGATLITDFQVSNITNKIDAFEINAEDGRKLETSYIVNCAGVYADKIANMVGDFSFNIYPSAGEYFLLDKKEAGLIDHTIFGVPGKRGKGVLATKTVDDNILLGPTAAKKLERDDDRTTAEGLDYVQEREERFFEGIPWKSVITSFAGVRAKCDRADFVIESPIKGFLNVAGIDSPGLTSAPAIALYVAGLLEEDGLLANKKENWNPKRENNSRLFEDMSFEEKSEFIKNNPIYGRIICRCEGITEGEIVEAIHQNPKPNDIDGIKRRTRAGMGRCQGGFCLTNVIEILAREKKVSIESITKRGNGSKYIYDRTKESNERI